VSTDTTSWDRFWSTKDDLAEVYTSSPRVLEAVLAWLPDGNPRVLEIGAGTGRDTAALAARGVRAVALDAAPEALTLMARAHPSLGGRAIVGGDALHLPFGDGTFDAVFHQGVLEHFANPHAFLIENFRVTQPGGVLIVDVPQTYHPWTLLKRAAMRVDRWFAGWETDFTMDQLEAAVAAAGYEVVGAYADTMVPSLAYRLVREAGKRAGIRLPLRPPMPEPLRRARERTRAHLLETRAARYLAHTIGVVGRRPEPALGR
jgi:SAM-dependent methyltransferase